jgi:hypothetical protein
LDTHISVPRHAWQGRFFSARRKNEVGRLKFVWSLGFGNWIFFAP